MLQPFGGFNDLGVIVMSVQIVGREKRFARYVLVLGLSGVADPFSGLTLLQSLIPVLLRMFLPFATSSQVSLYSFGIVNGGWLKIN